MNNHISSLDLRREAPRNVPITIQVSHKKKSPGATGLI